MTKHQFDISDEQWAKYEKWAEEQEVRSKAVYAHQKKKGRWVPSQGNWGGSYEWIFVQTGIGVGLHVKNRVTGDEIDLTEFDKW